MSRPPRSHPTPPYRPEACILPADGTVGDLIILSLCALWKLPSTELSNFCSLSRQVVNQPESGSYWGILMVWPLFLNTEDSDPLFQVLSSVGSVEVYCDCTAYRDSLLSSVPPRGHTCWSWAYFLVHLLGTNLFLRVYFWITYGQPSG